MPSLDQIQELLNNCTSKWTSVNGTYGREFTGPNGGKVFLPAAGRRWRGDLDGAGYGSYWSSKQHSDYAGYGVYAYGLNVASGIAYWYSCYRSFGLSVRPVSK